MNFQSEKSTSTTFATSASIKQSTITISDADSSLEGDINTIVATEKIANEGLLVYEGEGINKNVIEGTGNLTIDGTIENSTGTAISQNAIAITNGNGFKTRADDITTTEGIENNGTLTFIGGPAASPCRRSQACGRARWHPICALRACRTGCCETLSSASWH